MAMTELCAHFGIAPSTGGPWLIAVDGLVVDARHLPVAIQEVAVLKGLIPYLNPRSEEDTA
jgi:predicted Rdx family selenoprotein